MNLIYSFNQFLEWNGYSLQVLSKGHLQQHCLYPTGPNQGHAMAHFNLHRDILYVFAANFFIFDFMNVEMRNKKCKPQRKLVIPFICNSILSICLLVWWLKHANKVPFPVNADYFPKLFSALSILSLIKTHSFFFLNQFSCNKQEASVAT